MEDIAKIAAGIGTGVAADEGIRYLTKERPSEFAQSIAEDITATTIKDGKEIPLHPEFLMNGRGESAYYLLKAEGRPKRIFGLVFLNIPGRGKYWIEAYRVHGWELDFKYKGEKIPLDEPARGVKGFER